MSSSGEGGSAGGPSSSSSSSSSSALPNEPTAVPPESFAGVKRPRSEEDKELDNEYGPSVRLDVQGTPYRIPVAWIKKHPKSYLANLIEVGQTDEKEEKIYRVDRDPQLFRFIVDFYRGKPIKIPITEGVDRMADEIDFFLLPIKREDIEIDRPESYSMISRKYLKRIHEQLKEVPSEEIKLARQAMVSVAVHLVYGMAVGIYNERTTLSSLYDTYVNISYNDFKSEERKHGVSGGVVQVVRDGSVYHALIDESVPVEGVERDNYHKAVDEWKATLSADEKKEMLEKTKYAESFWDEVNYRASAHKFYITNCATIVINELEWWEEKYTSNGEYCFISIKVYNDEDDYE